MTPLGGFTLASLKQLLFNLSYLLIWSGSQFVTSCSHWLISVNTLFNFKFQFLSLPLPLFIHTAVPTFLPLHDRSVLADSLVPSLPVLKSSAATSVLSPWGFIFFYRFTQDRQPSITISILQSSNGFTSCFIYPFNLPNKHLPLLHFLSPLIEMDFFFFFAISDNPIANFVLLARFYLCDV